MAVKIEDRETRNLIVRLYYNPEYSTKKLAKKFGVSRTAISNLIKSEIPEKVIKRLVRQKTYDYKNVLVDDSTKVRPCNGRITL